MAAAQTARPPVVLHLMHSWGGGLEHWVRRYIAADRRVEHLVLQPVGDWRAFGRQLRLTRTPAAASALGTWRLKPTIRHTAVRHAGYDDVLRTIIDAYQVDFLFVSSLIGHSLDALRQGLPTCVLMHDYHPFCPALNVTYGGVCTACERERLGACFRDNENNRFFIGADTGDWMRLRAGWREVLTRDALTFVAPSASVGRNLRRLEPAFAQAAFHCIAHGTAPLPRLPRSPGPRLKILIPGSLALNKGRRLLEQVMPDLLARAEVTILGCGLDAASRFTGHAGLEVIPVYAPSELAGIVARIEPDVAIILATVAETFSYTLSEMFALGIPVVATRIGSFEDRIDADQNGWLIEPRAEALLDAVVRLQREPWLLERAWRRLAERHAPTYADMVSAYHRLLGIRAWPTDLPLPAEFDAPAPAPPAPETEGLRGRLVGLHLSVYARLASARRLPRKLRWWLMLAYHTASMLPHWSLRLLFRLLGLLRGKHRRRAA